MPLHPQAAAILRELPVEPWCEVDSIRSMTAERARAIATQVHEGGALDSPGLPVGISVEELHAGASGAPPPMRVYRPRRPAPGIVLWLQGGGFVLPPPATDPLAAALAATANLVVVTVEYRLAPEHPFPAAPEDCYAALCWLSENGLAAGEGPTPVAVGGESAGGNLAAALSLMARSRGGPEIALQALLYPMTARDFDGPSRHDPELGVVARPEAIEWLWTQYLGSAASLDPLASPLHAGTLAGLPPALVVTAEYDVLRDEGEAYAERLAAAGVPVERRRYDGMFHGFASFPGAIDAAARCVEQLAEAFRQRVPGEGAIEPGFDREVEGSGSN